MKPWHPSLRYGLVLLSAAAVLAALGMYLVQPDLTIAVHQGVEGGPMKKVAKLFCDTYRGKVEIVELDYDQLFEAEWSAVTGKPAKFPFSEPPRFDVIMLDDPWLPAFAGKGGRDSKVLALDAEQLAGRGGMDDFPKPCREICRNTKDGKYYAMPFTGNSQLFCSAKNGKNPISRPANWNDVTALPANKDKLAYAMRLRPGNSVVTDFLPILWAFAPGSFQDDYTKFDVDQAQKGFAMFYKLAEPQHWASAVTQDVDVAVSLALGSASTGIVWNAWAMALERLKDTNPELEFDFTRSSDPQQQPLLGAWLLAIPASAPHPAQAKEFIKFAVDPEQLEIAAGFGNPPPRISVLKHHTEKPYPAILDSLSNARPRPRTPCWREVERTLSNALSNWREDRSTQVLAKLKTELEGIQKQENATGCAAQ